MFFRKIIKRYNGHPIRWQKQHDGYGMEVSLDMILEQISLKHIECSIAISKNDNTIKLNIPHGELYHHCSELEWRDILKLFNLTEEEK